MSYLSQGKNLPMMHSEREVHDKDMIKAMIDMCDVCSIAFFDEKYPYIVPVNFGYEWNEEPLVLYIHGARNEGHRQKLLEQNPHVCVQMNRFLDRNKHAAYRGEKHDYRSVTIFGTMEEVTSDEEYVRGINLIQKHNHRRAAFKTVTKKMRNEMCIWRIQAEEITAKSQYEIQTLSEVPMPPL